MLSEEGVAPLLEPLLEQKKFKCLKQYFIGLTDDEVRELPINDLVSCAEGRHKAMMFSFTKVLIQVLKTSFKEFGRTTNISVTVTFTDKDTGVIDCPLVDDTFTIFSRSIYGKEIESLDSITSEYKDKPAKLVICDGPTKIGDGAFEGCSGLSSVTIPRSVTTIGERAFAGCSGLSCVGIPRSVTTIGERAFSGCSALSSITIGRSVTTIGDSVFEGCCALSSATKLILMTTLEYLNEENRYQSLFGCENNTTISG